MRDSRDPRIPRSGARYPSRSRDGYPPPGDAGVLVQMQKKSKAWHTSGARIMVLPTAVILLMVGIMPLIYSLALTFHDWTLGRPGGPIFVWFRNYGAVVKDLRFWESLKTSFIFTAAAVSAEFVVGMALALLFSRTFRGNRLVRTLLLIPMMLAPIVAGLIWRFMYNPQIGIINFLLRLIHVKGPIWLGDPFAAIPAVVLVDVWQWAPFMFLMLFTGISSLPVDVYEAARVDGTSAAQRFFYVTLPLLRPIILVAVVIRVIDTLRIFDTIFVLTRGGPANMTEVLSIYTYKVGMNFFRMGYATTMSYFLLIIITMVAKVFVDRLEEQEG
jgi:multiple sugar transport system permease protein